jgi:hypothetical protein
MDIPGPNSKKTTYHRLEHFFTDADHHFAFLAFQQRIQNLLAQFTFLCLRRRFATMLDHLAVYAVVEKRFLKLKMLRISR